MHFGGLHPGILCQDNRVPVKPSPSNPDTRPDESSRHRETREALKKEHLYPGGHVPFGYKKELVKRAANGKRQYRLVEVPEHIEWMKQVHQWRLQGIGWRQCAEKAAGLGWTAPKGATLDPSWLCKVIQRYVSEQKKSAGPASSVQGKPPYGYRINADTGEQEENPEEQSVINKIRAFAMAGMNHRDIAVMLRTQGLKTRQGRHFLPTWIGRVLKATLDRTE